MTEPTAKKARTSSESPNVLCLDEATKKQLMELDNCQFFLDSLNEKASQEIINIEQHYSRKRIPIYETRRKIICTIPSFWLTALLNHHILQTAIPEKDEVFLSSLRDIEVEDYEDIKAGYRIKLTFDKNNYFENDVIIKNYNLIEGESTTSDIDWKPGMKPVPNEDGRDITFLEWLSMNLLPDNDEIAEVIKDDLYINPLQYYVMPAQPCDDEELEELTAESESNKSSEQ